MRKEMRICLYPWDGYKSSGPYLHAKNGRQHINLLTYNGTSKHLNVTYAKYLAAIKCGRIPEKGEEVDHIDGDRTNDTLGNLRIISKEENQEKALVDPWYQSKKRLFVYLCNSCGASLLRTVTNAPHLYSKKSVYCSRACFCKGNIHHTGLLFEEQDRVKVVHKGIHEKWIDFSRGITEFDKVYTNNYLKDKGSIKGSIAMSGKRRPAVCLICHKEFTTVTLNQVCCSYACARIKRYGVTPITETMESYRLIQEGKTSWVKEALKYGITDNALRRRVNKIKDMGGELVENS